MRRRMPRHKQKRNPQPSGATDSVVSQAQTFEWVGLAVVLLLTVIVYFPVRNGGVLWDDDSNLTRPELRSLGGLYRIWFDPAATSQYYPLVNTAFWLEHKLWGDAVLGYHLVSLFWHMLAVLLVYLLLQKLEIPGGLLAAAIFALHPVMVESVAWMTEQRNTLSAVFYLGALFAFLEFDESRRRAHYFSALGLFALALLTKTATVTLPVALLVIFCWRRGTLSWRRDVFPLIPFFAIGAGMGLLTMWVERTFVGANGMDFELALPQRFLLAGRAVWFYLAKLAWPDNLTFIYPRWTIDTSEWWQWLFPIAAVLATVVLWAIRKRSRAPLAAWLFFCGTLFPVLGFLNVYYFVFSFVADHFQYLASLGMIALASSAATVWLQRRSELIRRVGQAFLVMLVGLLALLSVRQTRMYADAISLYQATLDRNATCWLAHNNLGLALFDKDRREEAMDHYRQALRLKPDYFLAHNNLATALVAAARYSEAVDELRSALAEKPDDPLALNGLGVALVHVGRLPEAIETLENALRADPNFAMAHTNLGFALHDSGDIPGATEQFRRALELNPDSVSAHINFGNLLVDSGHAEEGIRHFEDALQLQPNQGDIHNNLGDAFRQVGQLQKATEHYRAAMKFAPDNAAVYASLAQTLAMLNRCDEALAIAGQGIEVARRGGQQSMAEQIEEWLNHYQIELRRAGQRSP
jgi:tetratricopeptide (TPR) repeat protein